jgi:hypothetical protein
LGYYFLVFCNEVKVRAPCRRFGGERNTIIYVKKEVFEWIRSDIKTVELREDKAKTEVKDTLLDLMSYFDGTLLLYLVMKNRDDGILGLETK